ncbi:MAG: hypothetical protein KatS3mg011_2014 [Acidimicrobiia bacterium]|nr:MAG: hypothetical protein KatS3mg011_2014 [Acidimicrobiia bacterium]
MRSARAAELGIEDKIEATWDIDDPIFTERERAALEMATLFTEDYRSITDEHLERWKQHFTDEELIELGTFMALADGFGKLVEFFGLGDADQSCQVEI